MKSQGGGVGRKREEEGSGSALVTLWLRREEGTAGLGRGHRLPKHVSKKRMEEGRGSAKKRMPLGGETTSLPPK